MDSNRPFSRSVIKIAIRLALGSAKAHVQDWFPGLKLERASPTKEGTICYRGELVGRLKTSGRALPEGLSRMLIIGSGPSVKQMDLSRADDSACVLLNGALNLVSAIVPNPLAAAIEDERFVWQHFDLVKRIPSGCTCLLSVSVIRAICELDRSWLKDRTIVLIDDIRKPYGSARRDTAQLRALSAVRLSEDDATGFSEDPDFGVFQAGSVVISALQFAVSRKPRQIGLLGIDISNADEPRFYEKTDQAYSGIRRAQERIIAHLMFAKNIAAEIGIEVANHSPVSVLVDRGYGYDDSFVAAR